MTIDGCTHIIDNGRVPMTPERMTGRRSRREGSGCGGQRPTKLSFCRGKRHIIILKMLQKSRMQLFPFWSHQLTPPSTSPPPPPLVGGTASLCVVCCCCLLLLLLLMLLH